MEPLVKTKQHERVGIIYLNRPDQLNALSRAVMTELAAAARAFDADQDIGCIVITGVGRAFAAGADIKEMLDAGYDEIAGNRWFNEPWTCLTSIETPVLAAVNGYALGGGCELALMCDIIIASEKAKFGQPEIKLGIMPGMGGSQRLARFIGKPMTMDLCLSGRTIDAHEAKSLGMVSRVLEHESFEEQYLAVAQEVCSVSRAAARNLTNAIDEAFDMPLNDALENERQRFYSCFTTQDQKEGMEAFLEKRKPNWHHR